MRHFERFRFRRTTLLTLAYGSFLGGVGVAYHHVYFVPQIWLWCLAGLLLLFHRRTLATLLIVICLGLGLGLNRGSLFMQKLMVYEPYYGQKVSLTTRAMNDAIYGKGGQLSFDANHIQLDDGTQLTGRVQLSGFGLNSVYQGDEVRVNGKLRPGFGAYQGRMSYGRLELIAHNPSLVADIRRRFAAGLQSVLPEPLAPFALGLLIGQRATLPDTTKEELKMVGLTHIIAASGYNLTIILRASKQVFGRASKRMATFLALALIAVFLLVTGASASIVRAAIVSVLSIAAAYYGRNFKPVNLLLLAATITVWANPNYLWSDIGWYLSFLAFYGVMVLAPTVNERLWPDRQLPLPAAVAVESICAEIMTLPYILHVFGEMSLIGLPANVLVVTMVPLAMLLGVISGLAGMFITPIAGWLAWPAELVLTYMLDIAHILSNLPNVFVEHIGLSLRQMLLLYAVIIAVTTSLRFKIRPQNGNITGINSKERLQLERT